MVLKLNLLYHASRWGRHIYVNVRFSFQSDVSLALSLSALAHPLALSVTLPHTLNTCYSILIQYMYSPLFIKLMCRVCVLGGGSHRVTGRWWPCDGKPVLPGAWSVLSLVFSVFGPQLPVPLAHGWPDLRWSTSRLHGQTRHVCS